MESSKSNRTPKPVVFKDFWVYWGPKKTNSAYGALKITAKSERQARIKAAAHLKAMMYYDMKIKYVSENNPNG